MSGNVPYTFREFPSSVTQVPFLAEDDTQWRTGALARSKGAARYMGRPGPATGGRK